MLLLKNVSNNFTEIMFSLRDMIKIVSHQLNVTLTPSHQDKLP